MNNHSQMSKDEAEQMRQKILRQKIDEIRKVNLAFIEKKKDVNQAVEKICEIIDSVPDTILSNELKKHCRSKFEKAKEDPGFLSVAIEKVLAVISFVLNPKENTKILKDTERHILLKKLERAENETNFALRNKRPKTFKDSVLNELSNIKFCAR